MYMSKAEAADEWQKRVVAMLDGEGSGFSRDLTLKTLMAFPSLAKSESIPEEYRARLAEFLASMEASQ